MNKRSQTPTKQICDELLEVIIERPLKLYINRILITAAMLHVDEHFCLYSSVLQSKVRQEIIEFISGIRGSNEREEPGKY